LLYFDFALYRFGLFLADISRYFWELEITNQKFTSLKTATLKPDFGKKAEELVENVRLCNGYARYRLVFFVF
jgi:hypothetical protein